MELLIGGKQAFPVILDEIGNAQRSIYINMFVWRDDVIGNDIARALLNAADRGVKIDIIKDRYGILYEYSEEDQSSFFHKDPNLMDIIRINAMKFIYQPQLLFRPSSRKDDGLLNKMIQHPNIRIKSDEYILDHSKYYIFDDRIIITGGINVEDKENGADINGNEYIDYMVKIADEKAVVELKKALNNDTESRNGLFGLNIPGIKDAYGIRKRYLDLINDSEKELSIIMSYTMPIKDVLDALKRALKRGVKIRILFPEKSNYLNDANRESAMKLYDYAKKNSCDLKIYMSGRMTHIKSLMSDKTISIGSANITGKSLGSQGELNVFVPNDGSEFAKSVKESFDEIFDSATLIKERKQLKYRKLISLMESSVMS